jgi:hypothetical protein
MSLKPNLAKRQSYPFRRSTADPNPDYAWNDSDFQVTGNKTVNSLFFRCGLWNGFVSHQNNRLRKGIFGGLQ